MGEFLFMFASYIFLLTGLWTQLVATRCVELNLSYSHQRRIPQKEHLRTGMNLTFVLPSAPASHLPPR